jgi:hypothetical protein
MGENDQRPYPAGAFLCVDVATEFLFSPVVYQPGTNQETQAAQTLLGAIRKSKIIPATVMSEEAEWLDGMVTIAETLGIELYVGETPIIRNFGVLMRKSLEHM